MLNNLLILRPYFISRKMQHDRKHVFHFFYGIREIAGKALLFIGFFAYTQRNTDRPAGPLREQAARYSYAGFGLMEYAVPSYHLIRSRAPSNKVINAIGRFSETRALLILKIHLWGILTE